MEMKRGKALKITINMKAILRHITTRPFQLKLLLQKIVKRGDFGQGQEESMKQVWVIRYSQILTNNLSKFNNNLLWWKITSSWNKKGRNIFNILANAERHFFFFTTSIEGLNGAHFFVFESVYLIKTAFLAFYTHKKPLRGSGIMSIYANHLNLSVSNHLTSPTPITWTILLCK